MIYASQLGVACVVLLTSETTTMTSWVDGSDINTFSYMNRIYDEIIYCKKSFQLIKTVSEFIWFLKQSIPHQNNLHFISYTLCTYQLYPSTFYSSNPCDKTSCVTCIHRIVLCYSIPKNQLFSHDFMLMW